MWFNVAPKVLQEARDCDSCCKPVSGSPSTGCEFLCHWPLWEREDIQRESCYINAPGLGLLPRDFLGAELLFHRNQPKHISISKWFSRLLRPMSHRCPFTRSSPAIPTTHGIAQPITTCPPVKIQEGSLKAFNVESKQGAVAVPSTSSFNLPATQSWGRDPRSTQTRRLEIRKVKQLIQVTLLSGQRRAQPLVCVNPQASGSSHTGSEWWQMTLGQFSRIKITHWPCFSVSWV